MVLFVIDRMVISDSQCLLMIQLLFFLIVRQIVVCTYMDMVVVAVLYRVGANVVKSIQYTKR